MVTTDPNTHDTATNFPADQPAIPANVPIKLTPTLKISLIILGLLLVSVFAVSLLRRTLPPTDSITILPVESPVGTVSIPPRQVSEFAKTIDFINFEDDLNQLKQENTSVNLTEAELTFPLLDMKVSFEK